MLTVEALKAAVASGEIDTVVTAFPDMQGRLMGKRITGHYFINDVLKDGVHACDYLLACDTEMDPVPGYEFTSWDKGYGDFHLVPDLNTLRRTPWIDKTAMVLCDLYGPTDHKPVEVAPRQILRAQLEKAKSMGFSLLGASELEFYLFKDSYEEAHEKQYKNLQTYGWFSEDYHVLQSTKEEWIIRAIRNGMDAADIPIEFSKGEWGPGQHEINLRYAEVLEMCDRHTLYKHGVKEIAALNDIAITFMAKWDTQLAGSSCHIHASLWDAEGKKNVFFDESQPSGMSKVFGHWIAGQLAHAQDLGLLYAPFVNSYKRYQDASFAPTAVVWSTDNRTAGFRVLGHGGGMRVENRIPGADANPYMAFAGLIAAGLEGIERELELPDELKGNAYNTPGVAHVPKSLEDAVNRFERSEFATKAFGEMVVKHYAHAGREELRKYNRFVTDWELRRHFERT